jgi:LysM repeat protein
MRNHTVHRLWLAGGIVMLVVLAGCFQQAGTGIEPLAVAQIGPTFTPFPSDTPVPLPTEPPTLEPIVAPTETPVVLPTETPTEGVAIAQVATDPAAVPPDTQNQEIDPIFITATFIVQRATEVEAANMTATAGGAVPFATNTPEAVIQPTQADLAPTQPILSGTDCIHEVRVEDRNLFRISLRYGVPLMDIARVSGVVNPNLIVVGQKLTIPGCGTTGAVPPPTSAPAGTTGTGSTQSDAGQGGGVAQPTTGGTTYTVQQGETLYEISVRFGVPVNTIAAANGLTDINRIFINQQLVIPGR